MRKFAHVINDSHLNRGGKQQFVNELAGSEDIVYSRASVVNNGYSAFIETVNKTEADIVIFHDIIQADKKNINLLKESGKKLVFIAHDYYPICERFTLINNRDMLCSGPYHNNCIHCYIDKFPMLSNLGRATQNLIIPALKPINSRLRYYYDRLDNMRNIMKIFDLIIFPTEKTKKIMMRFFDDSFKTAVINHFQIPLKAYSDNEKPVFAFLGNDSHHKGIDLIYGAMKILTDRRIKIMIYGEVNRKVKDKRINYMGPFDYSDKQRIFSTFNTLIFPSVWPETWGRVLSESAISGKFIITSNITQYDEILKSYSGYKVFAHNSEKSLAKMIANTVKNWNNIKFPFENAVYKSVDQYREDIVNTLEES